MTAVASSRGPCTYRVGIDVGTHSVGFAAFKVDSEGRPTRLLCALSQIHDSGVYNHKNADTRLKVAGVARRARRMRRRRVKRLEGLDDQLRAWGWVPLEGWDYDLTGDGYTAWRARARLATEPISDPDELGAHLATALRHIARHRGWRNPYVRVSSLYEPQPPSSFLAGTTTVSKGVEQAVPGFKQRVEAEIDTTFAGSVTVGELAVAAIDGARAKALRMGKTPSHVEKQFSFIGGKLLQSDNANEIHTYARVQGLDREQLSRIIDLVFAAETPRGSWSTRIGEDPLSPGKPRASRATEAFQGFRIAQALGNVRVELNGEARRLTVDERGKAYEYLVAAGRLEEPTWTDVARALGHQRRALSGVAQQQGDGNERLPLRPPIHATDVAFFRAGGKGLGRVRDWWEMAGGDERDAFIELLVDGKPKSRPGQPEWEDATAANTAAWEVLNDFDDEELVKLDSLDLQAGRAAYSTETLRAITKRILASEDDLHSARRELFGLSEDWSPPAVPIGEPIGHPAVDHVTKTVSRWLAAAQAEWGSPQAVTLEHVRAAFVSEAKARKVDRENQRRHSAKLKQRETVGRSVGSTGDQRIRDSDVRRFEAVQRQNSQCAYCGTLITYDNCELDHIVPRKGVGSTNTRSNLVAACIPCNRSKSDIPFAAWAEKSSQGISVDDAVERTHHWQPDRGVPPRTWRRFLREVRDRFEQVDDDPPIDARSMESVAWMANELRSRIAAHFAASDTKVTVYRGALTAQARAASGIAERIPWAGGSRSKDRFDRRHHAVDASVTALLNPSVAQTLAERISIRDAESTRGAKTSDWKDFVGGTEAARARFQTWLSHMDSATQLLVAAFEQDEVVVGQYLRLRLANGPVHDDTIRRLSTARVSSAFTAGEISRASTPALWTALTRDPEYDPATGLPANPQRTLRLHGTWLGPDQSVKLFPRARAMLAVRGGCADAGTIHHARIFRWEEKGETKYGMLGVYAIDLARHRKDDLFAVELPASSLSRRLAGAWSADLSGREYLGWLVPGDVLELSVSQEFPGAVQAASAALGPRALQKWRVVSFDVQGDRIKLTPMYLAEEGLERYLVTRDRRHDALSADDAADVKAILTGNCWRPSVSMLFSHGQPRVIRRDSLGRERSRSPQHLPTSWSIVG